MGNDSQITNLFGMASEEVVSTFQNMTMEERETFLYRIDKMLDDMEDDFGHEIVEATASQIKNLAVKDSYFKALNKAASDLSDGTITTGVFNKRVHTAIEDSFTKTYKKVKGKLTPGDKEWIKRASNAEFGYAKKWGADIKAGKGPSTQVRAGRFSRSLDGVAWNADVENQELNTRIFWRLGDAEHCIDCILLALNNPYTQETLPTTPVGGDTQCHQNCKCRLEYKKGKLSKQEKEDVKRYETVKDQSLFQMIKPQPPPKGLRVPTTKERSSLDRLYNSMNFHRRKIAQKTAELELAKTATEKKIIEAELSEAITARKNVNKKLIDYMDERDIHDVPLWSVDDVISGADISLQAEADIFKHAIDGKSLDLASKRAISQIAAKYEREIGKKFGA